MSEVNVLSLTKSERKLVYVLCSSEYWYCIENGLQMTVSRRLNVYSRGNQIICMSSSSTASHMHSQYVRGIENCRLCHGPNSDSWSHRIAIYNMVNLRRSHSILLTSVKLAYKFSVKVFVELISVLSFMPRCHYKCVGWTMFNKRYSNNATTDGNYSQ